MDVTKQILAHNNIYGPSDYTGPHTLSASRSLNYAEGASISKPQVEKLNVIPFTFKYEDAVGLFGTENRFVRVDVDVDRDFSKACYEEPGYDCAEIGEDKTIPGNYNKAVIDRTQDLTTVNTYEPAEIVEDAPVPLVYDAYISVDLNNLKTGNQYIDNWLDIRLYDENREELPDFTYVRLKSHFYVGFHARNTRRLPYNVELTVGKELRSGLPSTECQDNWEISQQDCICIEEEFWFCAGMYLYTESGDYVQAEVDINEDNTTVNSYQPPRVTLQGEECIPDNLADFLGIPRKGRVGQVPPPKTHMKTMRKDHLSDPCCTSCH